jgi:hypothetical protein
MFQPSPLQTETKKIRLFYPSVLKKRILKSLAEYYALTIKDLVTLIFPTPKETQEASVRRCLSALVRDGLVNRISYRPDDYPGYGTLPLACGLSFRGLVWAQENCAWADPKELIKDHSPLTLEHEIKRARFHIKIVKMCEKHGLELFWKKTDLKHTVEPDDVFAIKREGKIAYYFFELENKRKSFKELLEKYRRYEEYYGTQKCKDEWKDFRTFTVVTQIRSEEARQNILKFLAGEPVTEYRNGKGRAITNPRPIKRNNFWFSTAELINKDVSSKIFKTPRDYKSGYYSLLS